MKYLELKKILSTKIETGNKTVIPYIQTFAEPGYRMHDTTENVVEIILNHPQATNEMLDAACQAFCDIGTDGYWVHSLSHFTASLWKKRDQFPNSIPWLKKFYKIAFELANAGNDSCCDRLISDFEELARFDDDPKDFHLTMNNLSWMEWPEHYARTKGRIEHGLFESENNFKIWDALFTLRNPYYLREFDYKKQIEVIDIPSTQQKIALLTTHDFDVSEFDNLIEQELKVAINKIKTKLKGIPYSESLSESDKEELVNECQVALIDLNEKLSKLAII